MHVIAEDNATRSGADPRPGAHADLREVFGAAGDVDAGDDSQGDGKWNVVWNRNAETAVFVVGGCMCSSAPRFQDPDAPTPEMGPVGSNATTEWLQGKRRQKEADKRSGASAAPFVPTGITFQQWIDRASANKLVYSDTAGKML